MAMTVMQDGVRAEDKQDHSGSRGAEEGENWLSQLVYGGQVGGFQGGRGSRNALLASPNKAEQGGQTDGRLLKRKKGNLGRERNGRLRLPRAQLKVRERSSLLFVKPRADNLNSAHGRSQGAKPQAPRMVSDDGSMQAGLGCTVLY